MATNKHATIRYHALDKCFSNFARNYYIEDLIDACNKALYEFDGVVDGVKRRQVFDDIKFMESDQGWAVPLVKHKDGRRVYYRYADRNFTIKNQPVNEWEIEQIRDSLNILKRFEGIPQFEWLEELSVRLEATFGKRIASNPIVGFEQNPFLKGLSFFTLLFNAITNKRALRVEYQSFKHTEPSTFVIHPYYLKQYNSRWFLFGHNQDQDALNNLALDRLIAVAETDKEYIENESIDFNEYFDDVIGVTVDETQPVERILLKVEKRLWPYIETKPIHGSQKVKERADDYVLIELQLRINYELVSTIFSLCEGVCVIDPLKLRNELKQKVDIIGRNLE
jgi:predicted DNA-binding transcriptional regulator YafY